MSVAFLDNGTWRDSVFYNLLGEDFPRLAVRTGIIEAESFILTVLQLEYAHAAAPNVKLYINDYNIESMNNKSLAYADLARSLLDQGAPLDGIGFQCHFIGGDVPEDIAATANMFTDMGLEVAFTELDIRVPVNNRGLTNETWLEIQSVNRPIALGGQADVAQSSGLCKCGSGVPQH